MSSVQAVDGIEDTLLPHARLSKGNVKFDDG
jgi:hypothetical protein